MSILRLTHEAAIKQAKELTITAIQHGLIPTSKDPRKTAKSVYAFYSTLFHQLRSRND